MGEEAVLADSGRVGEIAGGAGRARSLAFLSSLRKFILLCHTYGPLTFLRVSRFFHSPPTRRGPPERASNQTECDGCRLADRDFDRFRLYLLGLW